MRYENALRAWETACGSIVGVDGGIDAVRRELQVAMRADQLPDFVLPLTVRERGFRVVYEPRALLYEDALAAAGDEFRMRVRVSLRALHALRDKRALLDPWRFGLFAWQLWSHKLLRYLAPLFQVGALASNAVLAWGPWSFWKGLFAAQLLFYVLAWAGHRRRGAAEPAPRHPGLLSLPGERRGGRGALAFPARTAPGHLAAADLREDVSLRVPDCLVAACVEPAWDLWETRGRRLASWRRLRRRQWDPPAAVEARRRAALAAIVRHAAATTPFYAERFAAAGLDPLAVRDIVDLARLPVLTKDDLRTRGAELFSRAVRARGARLREDRRLDRRVVAGLVRPRRHRSPGRRRAARRQLVGLADRPAGGGGLGQSAGAAHRPAAAAGLGSRAHPLPRHHAHRRRRHRRLRGRLAAPAPRAAVRARALAVHPRRGAGGATA